MEITPYGVEKGGNTILPAYINVNTGGIPTLRSLSPEVVNTTGRVVVVPVGIDYAKLIINSPR